MSLILSSSIPQVSVHVKYLKHEVVWQATVSELQIAFEVFKRPRLKTEDWKNRL